MNCQQLDLSHQIPMNTSKMITVTLFSKDQFNKWTSMKSHSPTAFILSLHQNKCCDLIASEDLEGNSSAEYRNQQEVQEMLSLAHKHELNVFVCIFPRNSEGRHLLQKLLRKLTSSFEIKPQNLFQGGHILPTSDGNDFSYLKLTRFIQVHSKSDLPVLVLPLMDTSKLITLYDTSVFREQSYRQISNANESNQGLHIESGQNGIIHTQHNAGFSLRTASLNHNFLSSIEFKCAEDRRHEPWDRLIACHSASNIANVICSSSPEELRMLSAQSYTIFHFIVSSHYCQEEVDQLLNLLVRQGMQDLMIVPNDDGDTPLHIAVRRNQAVVSALLQYVPADSLLMPNKRGHTPLHITLREKQRNTFYLLYHHILKSKSDEMGRQEFIHSISNFSIGSGHASANQKPAAKLSTTGPAKSGKSSLLHPYCLDKLRSKLSKGTQGEDDVASSEDSTSSATIKDPARKKISDLKQKENTKLDASHSKPHTRDSQVDQNLLCKITLSPSSLTLYDCDISEVKKGMCIIMGLVKHITELVNQFRSPVDCVDSDGSTALNLAPMMNYYYSIVRLLRLAAFNRHDKAVSLLITRFGCSPYVRSKYGHISLRMVCCGTGGHLDVVRKLVSKHSCDILTRIREIVTRYRCPVDCVGCDGSAPLHLAMQNGHSSVVRLLLTELVADANINGNIALPYAAWNKPELVSLLIMEFECSPHVKDTYGHTFFHMACDGDYTPLVAALTGSGAVIRELVAQYKCPVYMSSNGKTPLCLTSSVVRLSICDLTASTTIKDKASETAYFGAINTHHLEVVSELVRQNCDPINLDAIYMLPSKLSAIKLTEGSVRKVFVVGNPQTSKSAVIEAFKDETWFTWDVIIKGVPPHTAGIIPVTHQSSLYGRIIFYDFAGDREYYSSHATSLEKLMDGPSYTFLVFNLSGLGSETLAIEEEHILYWLKLLSYSSKAATTKPRVVSHADILLSQGKNPDQLMDEIYPETTIEMAGYTALKSLQHIQKQIPSFSEMKEFSVGASVLMAVLSSCTWLESTVVTEGIPFFTTSFDHVEKFRALGSEATPLHKAEMLSKLSIFARSSDSFVSHALYAFFKYTESHVDKSGKLLAQFNQLPGKAVRLGNPEAFKLLFEMACQSCGCETIKESQFDYRGDNVLHIAVNLSEEIGISNFKIFLQQDTFDTMIIEPNLEGDTPLHNAARLRNPEVFELLFEKACRSYDSRTMKENPLNCRGDNVLHIAINLLEEIGISNFKILLQHDNLDTMIIERNLEGDTPLHNAARLRNPEVFELLFEKACRSYDSRTMKENPLNCRGDNVLHIAINLLEEIGISNFKILLQHDNLDTMIIERNLEGDTPLHNAARLRNPEVFELLFEKACRSYDSRTMKENPLNCRGDNVLHIAINLLEEIGISNFKILLQHDNLDTMIIERNLEGDTPLHNAARLRNPEVFELLFEEACRSYGCRTIKEKFSEFFELSFKYIHVTVAVVFRCGGDVTNPVFFGLALKQFRDQWFLIDESGNIPIPYMYYCSQTLINGINPNLHECLDSRPGKVDGLDVKLSKKISELNPKQCSNTDFKNAVMCHSVHGPYQLYSNIFSTNPSGECCTHIIEQHVVIPTGCSPVPPYLGKKTETLRQGSTSDKRCSSNCREQGTRPSDTRAKAAPRGVHEYKKSDLFPQTSFSAHSKMQHKIENRVEADEARVAVTRSRSRQQEQKMNIHVQHFNQAADCLHAQDYVRMLHSLPYCSICNPSVLSNMSMDHKTQITYLFGCGLAHVKLAKQKEAIRHFQTCESVAAKDEHMHRGDIALCNQNLGDILLAKQSFISAAEYYSKAVDYYSPETVAQNFKMIIPSISGLYSKLASALRNASKVVDAVQAYKNAIATAESKKDKLSAHTSLGNLYQSVGENASALSEYEHSIELSEELEDYVSLGWAHGNMGNACLGLYQRDKALYHLDKSLKLALSHEPTPQAIGRAFNNLGTAHQALNEYDKAQENYDLALGQGIYGNDIPGQARVYGNIGNLLMVRQDYERAIPHYTEVLRLSKDRSTVSTAYHNRGCAYYELAESKKTAIFEKRPSKTTFYVHGLECMAEYQPLSLPSSVIKLYRHGSRDLEEVVRFHEETLNSIKGSTKGLTLSVSLFESNSRTFHRLQDCLVSLGEWKKALVVAEQSRTRTLGELLLNKKVWQLEECLSAPLNLDQITSIVKSQSLPVLYLSYTGARLLGWVLMPDSETVKMGMFEVPLKDDQFEGKSFDYHLRYSLNEVLVEKSFEMYRSCDYSSKLNDPVINLYNLIGKPLCDLLKQLDTSVHQPTIQSVLVIPDSYTNLLPFTCLLATDPQTNALRFLGDQYSFQLMPSLLTMGILDQLPSTTVMIPSDSRDMCVVGNPTIPPFVYNGEPWNLGRLPYATKEAQWVAHILGTTPILHEQATKSAVLMRILNSKVIHIATHGSAAAGFLAFAGVTASRNKEAVDSGSVLIYPRDIEKQNISPALVVLSSCDSGRGEVKADGIQGMTRAFILAGAQAVLTTLWRVPDESACIFMQFFYQYLVDGFCGSEALQKAILSVRCFSKYSQYIHWSGYQLTGRKIQFDIRKPGIFQMLETRLGSCSVFPRLDDVKKLELAFINGPRTPTDVQILRGSPGMKPSEPLIDFIHSFHHHFKGGIFWINGRTKELVEASTTYIEKVTGKLLPEIIPSDVQQVLVVLDYFEHLPTDEAWITFLKNPNVHIVVISKHYSPPELLRKEIDHQLLRGCNDTNIQPLSMVHTIQRIVHSIHEQHHLAPGNEVQELFEKLAELTSGSPAIIKVASGILLSHMKRDSTPEKVLQEFVESFSLLAVQTTCKVPPAVAESRCISRNVAQNILSVTSACDEVDPWKTDVQYDSWQVVSNIIAGSELSREEQLLLYSLSVFSCCPIPMSVVTEISTLIAKASNKAYLSGNLHSTLFNFKLMSIYPAPVILCPSTNQQLELETEFVYVPQYLSSGIWKHIMSPVDKAVALGTAFKALSSMSTRDTSRLLERPFFLGLCSVLLETFELNYELMGKQCYQEVYKLYLFLSYHVHTLNEVVPGKGVDNSW